MGSTVKARSEIILLFSVSFLLFFNVLLLRRLWFLSEHISQFTANSLYDISINKAEAKVLGSKLRFRREHKAGSHFHQALRVENLVGNHADTPRTSTANESGLALCSFPVLDPFAKSVSKFVYHYPTLSCSRGFPSIVRAVGSELRIDPLKVKHKLGLARVQGCRYRSLHRKEGSDFKSVSGPWSKTFTSSIRLRGEGEGGVWEDQLQVDCHHQGRLVARSYLALVRKRAQVEKQRQADYHRHVKEHSPRETLSVLMVGIEGTSRQNFIRSMPKTREFLLQEMKAIEMEKFNKVGLNTFPNVIPLLTGLHDKELGHSYNWTDKEHFDKIDELFIWNPYQKAGYRTSIVHDEVFITEFHYLKKGWSHPPFDFYPRPVVLKSEPDKVYRSKGGNCMGDTPEVTFHLDYWLRLATAYNNSPATPYFGYGLMNRLTHDYQDLASKADDLYLAFLRQLVKKQVLSNTLLIFFSDHGVRFGKVRYTYNGMLEAKMPIMFFTLPPWFEDKYPEVTKNLRTNAKDRLTTFFDVHATLKDLLFFTGNSHSPSPSQRGISLLSQIPVNRTCRQAGIDLQWCACNAIQTDAKIPTDVANHVVKNLLLTIQSYTETNRSACRLLQTKSVQYLYPLVPETQISYQNVSLYRASIQTTPGDVIYEASMAFNSSSHRAWVVGGVNRLNLFTGHEDCVPYALKHYCFCNSD